MSKKPLLFATLLLSITAASQSARGEDEPLFRIGTKVYTIRELTGLSESNLRERFRAEVREMSDERIAELLDNSHELSTPDQKKKPIPGKTRQDLESELWDAAIRNVVSSTSLKLGLADIGENLIRELAIDIRDYCDLAALKKSIRKEAQYITVLYTAPNDPSRDNSLREELERKLEYSIPSEHWKSMRRMIQKIPPVFSWHGEFLKNASLNEDVSVKAILAHSLLKDACERGYYRKQAVHLFQFERSEIMVCDISGYRGDEAALKKLFEPLVPEKGVPIMHQIGELKLSLESSLPSLKIRGKTQIGSRLVNELSVPPIGQIYTTGPSTYRILGWITRAPTAGVNENNQRGFDVFHNKYAYRMAGADFMSATDTYDGMPVHSARFAEVLSQDIASSIVLSDIKREDFRLRPIPSEVFTEYMEARKTIDTLALAAAEIELARNKLPARELTAQLQQKIAAASLPGVRKGYQRIVDQLAPLAKTSN